MKGRHPKRLGVSDHYKAPDNSSGIRTHSVLRLISLKKGKTIVLKLKVM